MSSSTLPLTFTKGFHDEKLCRKMEYRVLGRTGLKVSKVAFGCGTFGSFYSDLNVEEAIATVHKALKAGINYIDTAPYYGVGQSEKILGMALKDVPRSAYYLAIKVGRYETANENMFHFPKNTKTRQSVEKSLKCSSMFMCDFSMGKTRLSVSKSLKFLGVKYVDVIQIHIENAKDLDIVINVCLPELEKIVQEGKAKFIGISGYPLKDLKEYIIKAKGRFDTVLTTLCDDSIQSYLDFFKSQNLGVICASYHALGLHKNGDPQPWQPTNEAQQQLCRKAEEICIQANIELGKLALHSCMQLDGPATFLTGMENCKLLDLNMDAFHSGLSKKEQEVLKYLKDKVFIKSINWEGYELEHYWATRNILRKKNTT